MVQKETIERKKKTVEEEITEQTKFSHDHQKTKTHHRRQLTQTKRSSDQGSFKSR